MSKKNPSSKATILFAGILLYLILLIAGCRGPKGNTGPQGPEGPPGPSPTYVGSDSCALCHASVYTAFKKSGHPYKLSKASDAKQSGYYPYSDLSGIMPSPSGITWDKVTYVIGGYGWKARFIGTDGYIITAGGQNQYNIATDGWVDFHKDETKPYDCGSCHTTGFNPSGHQDSLPGIEGTWVLPGIQCERCHGPGSLHIQNPGEALMRIDRSAEFCGECHVRGDAYTIPAKSGFIRHHEQYNELLASPMNILECIDCHDPHENAHWEPSPSLTNSCKRCHDETVDIQMMASFDCITCHMPYASKSAVGDTSIYQGDVRTHLFSINTDSLAVMFDSTGSYANGYLTLEFTCLSGNCHTGMTKSWASIYADSVHLSSTGKKQSEASTSSF